MKNFARLTLSVALCATMLFLVACNSGGGGGTSAVVNPASNNGGNTYSVSGAVSGEGEGIPVFLVAKDAVPPPSSINADVAGEYHVVKTGPNGEFSIEGVQEGVYNLMAQKSRFESGLLQDVTVLANVGSLTLYLTATGDISGTITISGEFAPLGVAAFVTGTSFAAFADADGKFKITGVPIGTHKVGFTGSGLVHQVKENIVVTAGNITALPAVAMVLDSIGAPDIAMDMVFGGEVIFKHSSHVGSYRKVCADCHEGTDPFPKKVEVGKYTMNDMKSGKSCGKCHKGEAAGPFGLHECARCHKGPHVNIGANDTDATTCSGCHNAVYTEFNTPVQSNNGPTSKYTHSYHWLDEGGHAGNANVSACGECHHHEAMLGTGHTKVSGSSHSITCATCHTPNQESEVPGRLRKAAKDLCVTCHHIRYTYNDAAGVPNFPNLEAYSAAGKSALPIELQGITETKPVAGGIDAQWVASSTNNTKIGAGIASLTTKYLSGVYDPTNMASTTAAGGNYPHYSSQYDVLMGKSGKTLIYFTKDLEGNALTTGDTKHRKFPNACVMCHMDRDQANGKYGHTFAPSANTCAPCHGANYDYKTKQAEIVALFHTLEGYLDADKSGDVKWTRSGTNSLDLKKVLGSTTLTHGTKALFLAFGWNYVAMEEDFSHGMHNYQYVKSVLTQMNTICAQLKTAGQITW